MAKQTASDALIEKVNRALWTLALDSWHAFSNESSPSDRTTSLSPFVLECAAEIAQAFVDGAAANEAAK